MDDKYKKLAERIGSLVDEKNAAYGNSFKEAGSFLALLYPDGISPDKYGDMLCIVRIFDKLKRIATKKGAFNESPYVDIVGYGLLGTAKDEEIARVEEARRLEEEKRLEEACRLEEEVRRLEEEKRLEEERFLKMLRETNVLKQNIMVQKGLNRVRDSQDYLILRIMEEGKSIRLAPLKKDRPEFPFTAENLNEVVETSVAEMGLKELFEGLKPPPVYTNPKESSSYPTPASTLPNWEICGDPPPLIWAECSFCKTLLPDGVPVKNMINEDRFSHQRCFEDHLRSLKNAKNGEPEHKEEDEVVGVGIDASGDNDLGNSPEPNMVKALKDKKKYATIKKKGTFVRHGR